MYLLILLISTSIGSHQFEVVFIKHLCFINHSSSDLSLCQVQLSTILRFVASKRRALLGNRKVPIVVVVILVEVNGHEGDGLLVVVAVFELFVVSSQSQVDYS